MPQPLNVPAATQPYDLSPGTQFDAWDVETGIQYMPNEQVTYDLEFSRRAADTPYFAGNGGVTSESDATSSYSSLIPVGSKSLVKRVTQLRKWRTIASARSA